jgi:acetyltransferase-like isoleucine patch superfamily enzyme
MLYGVKYLKSVLRNPLTEYVQYLINWWQNKLKFKKVEQGYFSFIKDSVLGSNVKIYDRAIISECEIGSYTYISADTGMSQVSLGKFCSIGQNCRFGLGLHPTQDLVSCHPVFFSTMKQVGVSFADKDYFEERKRIFIGNDVWIGESVTIFGGVTIGDGAIIGAGALVNKDVPAYAIYAGVPAKLIRYRFDEATIKFLLEFKWWDRNEEWLKNNFKDFHNIKIFLQKYAESRQ